MDVVDVSMQNDAADGCPHKDFSDLYDKMIGKGESTSEAHRGSAAALGVSDRLEAAFHVPAVPQRPRHSAAAAVAARGTGAPRY